MAVSSTAVSFGNFQQPFFQQAPVHTVTPYAPNFGQAFPPRLKDHSDCVPTPPEVAQRMIDILGVEPGMRVLEPSAGTGNIADEIAKTPGVNLDVVEYDRGLRDYLRDRGHHVVGEDFLSYRGQGYDRIIMNPPFSTKDKSVGPQSVAHVKHAYSMLKPGGKMAAILPEWIFRHNKGRNQREFHQWLKEHTGAHHTITLESGTFNNEESTTPVTTRILVIEKPAVKKTKKQSKRTKFRGSLDLVA